MDCFTCRVLTGKQPGAIVVWRDAQIVVNHTDAPGRSGWLVVSPVRHVTRTFEMTPVERTAVIEAAAALDAIVTELFGSTRTMVASLGQIRDDHVHVHVVPTFAPSVTYGYRNFGDAYVPVAQSVVAVAAAVVDAIHAMHAIATGG